MIIDCHAHYTPQSMLDALKKSPSLLKNVELLHSEGKYQLVFAGRDPSRPVSSGLRDPEPRFRWMSEQGIDCQVTGGWMDSFGYNLAPEDGAAWSRFLNEYLWTATESLDQMAPLATVPMQDGAAAANVLSEAMKAGFHGAMIGTQPKGQFGNLDDPDLDPFWSAASELGAAIFIHPLFGCGDPRHKDYGLMNAVARGVDTTTAVARLMFAGHFETYPNLKVVLPHGGGALPYLLGRLRKNFEIHEGRYADPATAFHKIYFDTVVHEVDTLGYLCNKVGCDHVVLGSDYPFAMGDMTPVKTVDAAGFTGTDREKILGANAAEIFRVKR
jgi:aminocarboxymuconate-semialdehyde decarboxylase